LTLCGTFSKPVSTFAATQRQTIEPRAVLQEHFSMSTKRTDGPASHAHDRHAQAPLLVLLLVAEARTTAMFASHST
jgi:hypothetical protein